MTSRSELEENVRLLKVVIDATERQIMASSMWWDIQNPYQAMDQNGRFILLDALAALVKGQTILFDSEKSGPNEDLTYDDQTLEKVDTAIASVSITDFRTFHLCDEDRMDLINAIQNAGILFRERK